MIKALIFDFDGLILDTETPAYESWKMIYGEHGQVLSLELWKDALGRARGYGFDALEHLVGLVGQPLDRQDVEARRLRHKYDLCESQALLPGVFDVLAQAREWGMPCAVASSSDREWVEGWLRRHEIYDYFACVRTAEDVEHAKPAPDLFLSAASCLGVAPEECLVFEDSPNGLRAATAAGMRSVAVPCGLTAQLDLPPSTLRLSSLDELPLPEIIARVSEETTVPDR